MNYVIIANGGFLAGVAAMNFAWGYDTQMSWAWTAFWGVMSLAAIVLTIIMIVLVSEKQ